MKTKITELLKSWPVQWLSRLILGGIFIYASIDKLSHPRAFADIIYNYKILPGSLVVLAAISLPWMEILGGICVITGLFKRAGTVVLGGMLTVFIAAISFNLARGLEFDCGCLTTVTQEGGSDPVGLLIRDLLLMITVVVILFFAKKKQTQEA